MIVNFSLETLARTLIAIADERPDYVYVNTTPGCRVDGYNKWCSYFHGREPGCIFGHAFARLGMNAADIPDVAIRVILPRMFPNIEEAAVLLFAQTQIAQDSGHPWGVAVEPLRRAYPAVTA